MVVGHLLISLFRPFSIHVCIRVFHYYLDIPTLGTYLPLGSWVIVRMNWASLVVLVGYAVVEGAMRLAGI